MRTSGTMTRAALAVLAAIASAGFAASDAAAWGAIAVATNVTENPAWGHSYRQGSQEQARRRAMDECSKRAGTATCEIKITLGSGCAAAGLRLVRKSLPNGNRIVITQLNVGAGRDERDSMRLFEAACRRGAETSGEVDTSECKVIGLACATRKPAAVNR